MSPEASDPLSQETQAAPARTLGSWVWLVAKVGVTVGLITWLIRSGGLNMTSLTVLWRSPLVAVVATFNFAIGVVCFGALRWRRLLSALGISVAVPRAVGLHWIAVFFNSFVPGNVGGDLIKNHAVVERDPGRLVTVALLERVLGLTALLWTAIPAVVMSGESLARHPGGKQLTAVVLVFFVLSILGLWAAYWLFSRLSEQTGVNAAAEGWASRLVSFVLQHLRSGADTLRLLAQSPRVIMQVLGLSLLMHAFAVTNFWFIARHLNNPQVTWAEMALVYPLGMLSIVLPISISGLGVGHLFFNELFKILDLQGGADVFNVAMVSSLALAASGAVPYLLMEMRPRGPRHAA